MLGVGYQVLEWILEEFLVRSKIIRAHGISRHHHLLTFNELFDITTLYIYCRRVAAFKLWWLLRLMSLVKFIFELLSLYLIISSVQVLKRRWLHPRQHLMIRTLIRHIMRCSRTHMRSTFLLFHWLKFFPKHVDLRIPTSSPLLYALYTREYLLSGLTHHVPLLARLCFNYEIVHEDFPEHIWLHEVGVETGELGGYRRVVDCFGEVGLENLVNHFGFGWIVENVFAKIKTWNFELHSVRY